jgi:hypothetical protein
MKGACIRYARGATTLSTTTFSITTLSIKGLFVTFSITTLCKYAECHHAECRVLFIVMLNTIMLSVFILNVVLLSVMAPCRSLTLKYYIMLESQARDKHSSLFCFANNDGEKSSKKFYNIYTQLCISSRCCFQKVFSSWLPSAFVCAQVSKLHIVSFVPDALYR